jgi:type II secretory pathway component PulF
VQPAPGAASEALPPEPLHLPARRLEELLLGLAQLLEAGLTLRMGLHGGAAAALPPEAAARLRDDTDAGLPLSESLDRLGVLDLSAVIQLHAGERTGTMPASLREVAARLAERRADRSALLFSLLRPSMTLLAAALILPLPTLVVSGARAYLSQALPGVLALTGAAVFLLGVWPRIPAQAWPKALWLRLGLLLPGLKGALQNEAFATFADVLGAGVRSGLPVREALVLAAGATPHPRFQEAAGEMTARLDGGATLTDAVSAAPLPAIFLAQVSSSEVSGTLDRGLSVLARSHRDLSRRAATTATSVAAAVIGIAVMGFAAVSIVQGFAGGLSAQSKAIERQIDN